MQPNLINAIIAVIDGEDHLATMEEWGSEEQARIKHNILWGGLDEVSYSNKMINISSTRLSGPHYLSM